jgi:vacuolar protein sorting-associated protein VTA1
LVIFEKMPLEVPPELKKIAPFIKRAEELDKDVTAPESRLVAYYLRQYAVQLGIPVAGSSPAAKACLGKILGDLEKEKDKMSAFTRDEAAFLCRKFADNVFNKADNEDRAGLAEKGTGKTFYAAQLFLQMLEQFSTEGDDSELALEDKKKIKYCKWKAAEILKALKEGRKPTPGAYGDDALDFLEDEAPAEEAPKASTEKPLVQTVTKDDDDFGLPIAPSTIPPKSEPVFPPSLPPPKEENDDEENEEGTEVALGPPPAYHSMSSVPAPDRPALSFDLSPIDVPPLPSVKPKTGGLFGAFKKTTMKPATKAQLSDAMELTRFALAALEDKDGDLAAERLQQALSALGR